MIPAFLVPDQVVSEDGQGLAVELNADHDKSLLLTLGITRIIEQESLDISVCGSADGETWKVLATFPQKFYCGTYSTLLDLDRHPGVQYLRAQWKLGRWGRGSQTPMFGLYLFAEEAKQRQVVGAA